MSDKKKTVHHFLFDTSNQTKHEAREELEAHGVDVAGFFAKIERTVQSAYMEQLGRIAAQEQAETKKQATFLEHLAELNKDQILALVKQIRSGVFGLQYKSLAVARCRNNDPAEMSVEELRSWLEDLSDMLGEPGE